MQNEINKLLEAIKSHYAAWQIGTNQNDPVRSQMVEEFNNSLSVEEGSKYLKIVQRGSVWGFIVKTDSDKKFKRGDILKAAGWATPARNQARGNILTGDLSWVRWTGPEYLK